jgi:hypothetical protein
VENFKMPKSSFFKVIDKLEPTVLKHNIKYQKTIPTKIYVSYAIYKLAHGYNFIICNDLFAIGKSTYVLALLKFLVFQTKILVKKLDLDMGQKYTLSF